MRKFYCGFWELADVGRAFSYCRLLSYFDFCCFSASASPSVCLYFLPLLCFQSYPYTAPCSTMSSRDFICSLFLLFPLYLFPIYCLSFTLVVFCNYILLTMLSRDLLERREENVKGLRKLSVGKLLRACVALQFGVLIPSVPLHVKL